MKIDYFFPVFEEDNIESTLKSFFCSKFFKENEDFNVVFCCYSKDRNNLEKLKNFCKNKKRYKILEFDKKFSYNDAFTNAIEYFEGDVVLLGDCKIEKIDVVFNKCLEKQKQGANIVHVVKRFYKFKGFITNVLYGVYNFFVKIFTNKKDRLNLVSLGLIDKDVLDLLKELPRKRCFLKNTKNLFGFETRSIYIEGNTKTYRPNYKEKTTSIKITYTASIIFCLSLVLMVVLNCLLKIPTIINVLLSFVILAGIILMAIFLPKHFFDVRNFPSKNVEYKIKIINKEK